MSHNYKKNVEWKTKKLGNIVAYQQFAIYYHRQKSSTIPFSILQTRSANYK